MFYICDMRRASNTHIDVILMSFPHLWLTHWGRDKMAAIFQLTFSHAFSWMKMYEFWLWFNWSVLLRVRLTLFQHWFRQWLGTGQATSHCLNQWWLIYWRIYMSLGLNELTKVKAFNCCHEWIFYIIISFCHALSRSTVIITSVITTLTKNTRLTMPVLAKEFSDQINFESCMP